MKPRHDGICEYLSRKVRVELVSLLLEHFSMRALASELGVSHAAVEGWLDVDGPHPSNQNLRLILELAFSLQPSETMQLLRADLRKHVKLVKEFSRGNRGVTTS